MGRGGSNKLIIEEVDKILKKYELEREGEYKNSNTKMKCVDSEGYIVMIKINNLKFGSKPSRFFYNNPYTEYNINNYIRVHKLQIKLKEGQDFKNSQKKFIFICLVHNREFEKTWSEFQKGSYCPFCSNSNHLVWEENWLANRKDLLIYLKNPQDAYKYSIGSEKTIELVCPYCKNERIMRVCQFTYYGFSCKNCSDGISIPEKFCNELLTQLEINFKTQYKIKNKRYDFYFEKDNKKWIIEVNGMQHYKESFSRIKGARSLKEEQQNDKYKKEIALDNNINKYIIVDCRISDFDYLKKQFTKSLEIYFNLNNIDWIKINNFCLSSLVKKTIDLFNSGCNTSEIVKNLNITKSTVITYLNKGNKSNLCNYKPKEQLVLNIVKINKHKRKIILQYDLEGNFVAEYPSATNASKKTNINIGHMCECARGERNHAGGFIWKYKNQQKAS